MKQKITIVSGIQITDNPRVLKEANCLAAHGYEVEVLLSILDSATKPIVENLSRDGGWYYTAVFDASDEGKWHRLRWQWLRLRKKVAGLLLKYFGIEDARQLGYFVLELVAAAKRSKADLYSLHIEQSLWVGHCLMQDGFKVGIDLEDWYSKDLLEDDRKRLPIQLIQKLEGELLRESVYSLTTSDALSKQLRDAYSVPAPAVVYNAFSLFERESLDDQTLDRRDRGRLSVVWFSQTVGPGRGLELLAEACHSLTGLPLEFHFRGAARTDYETELRPLFPADFREHVYFHPRVPHAELLSRIAEHDVGYAAEECYCQSRDLTITNKILQYLLGGVAVLASDTSGQKEVAELAPQAVSIFVQGDAKGLADQIRRFSESRSELESYKAAALRAAEERFCWEKSKPILLANVAKAFRKIS